MKARSIIILICIALVSTAQAQQVSQWSQYMINDYVLNPAIGGSKPYFDGKLSHRDQWSGITDAPRTFTMSLHGPTKNPNIGLGGMIFTDNVGPTRQVGGQATFSYHFSIAEDWKLSLGIGVGALQWSIDGDKITLIDINDPALYSDLRSKTVFDATYGMHFYSSKGYIGIAIPHIAAGRVSVFDTQDKGINQLERHVLLSAGYEFDIVENWKVAPSMMMKYVSPVSPKIDLSTRGIFKDMIWAGVGFRTGDALIVMAGYVWNESLTIGYSYDFTTSDLNTYSNGTHELVFGFRMPQ